MRSSLKPGKPPRRTKRVNPINKARRAKEWARAYHSIERVWWIANGCACVVPDCLARDCENAHTETGGMGRKADYTTVVPLCTFHHRKLHRIGRDTFEECYCVTLEEAARLTQQAWELSGLEVAERASADGRIAAWVAAREEQ